MYCRRDDETALLERYGPPEEVVRAAGTPDLGASGPAIAAGQPGTITIVPQA